MTEEPKDALDKLFDDAENSRKAKESIEKRKQLDAENEVTRCRTKLADDFHPVLHEYARRIKDHGFAAAAPPLGDHPAAELSLKMWPDGAQAGDPVGTLRVKCGGVSVNVRGNSTPYATRNSADFSVADLRDEVIKFVSRVLNR